MTSPFPIRHLCGGKGCFFCEAHNPTLFALTDKDKFDKAVNDVDTFLRKNYPCGCEGECEFGETQEATEIVRMVLGIYGNGYS
jgi:ferredoxin